MTVLKNRLRLLALIALTGVSFACAEVAPEAETVVEDYSYGTANRDGIGKFYMGREISYVMGHRGAAWLMRPEREREERTDLLLANLPLQPDSVVADIGVGAGYFALPIAQRVPEGKVYGVDIQPEMLDLLMGRANESGLDNIVPVLATEKDPQLPEGEVDLALFVDAYHEFEWPKEVMTGVYNSLKPGGYALLIEYRGEDADLPILRLHKMTEAQVKKELAAVGFELEVNESFLPQQHFLLFRKPE